MTTLELVLGVVSVALTLVIAHLLKSHARWKKQISRFQKLIDLEAEQTKVEDTISELRATRGKLESQIDVITSEKTRLEAEQTKVEDTISGLQSTRGKLEAQINKLTRDRSDLETDYEEVKEIISKKSRLKAEQAEVEKSLFELRATREKSQRQTDKLTSEKSRLEENITELQSQVSSLEDDLTLQKHGLYEPKYDFGTAAHYKSEIGKIRDSQKEMIRAKTAVVCNVDWTVSGSKAKGTQMTNKYIRLMARAFNGECDSIISKVKYNNIASIENRIESAYNAINKLGESHHCEINPDYLELKCEELHLVHEYQEKLQDEKEEARQIRERIRDEERAQRELAKAQNDADKETERYERALAKARNEVEIATIEEQAAMQAEVDRLNELLQEAQAKKERAISRAQLTRSGHVYVLSNIGAFGENVYKIGMTRRLEPDDRVKELSGPAVPFRFDVHAMIYSDDAPALETLLHNKLERQSVNRINKRKEFFNVTLEEIEKICTDIDAKADFIRVPEAEEFRKTQAILAEEQLQLTDMG